MYIFPLYLNRAIHCRVKQKFVFYVNYNGMPRARIIKFAVFTQ